MGNNKNKKLWRSPKRRMDQSFMEDLKASDKGSYYSTSSENEKPAENGESDEEEGTLPGVSIEEEVEKIISASERKLLVFPPIDYKEELDDPAEEEKEIKEQGNRILDISLLSDALSKAAKCSVCNSSGLSLQEKANSQQGWASVMYLFCPNCENKTTFSTSRHLGDKKTSPSVVNRSLVLGMRSIGRGRKAADILSAHLGLPCPLWSQGWAEHTRVLDEAAGDALQSELQESIIRLKQTKVRAGDADMPLAEVTIDCAASFDGSWKSRGFHSRHGFVSAISADTGEVLDCIYMTSLCRECAKWVGKKDTPEYLDFIAEHFPSCHLNHEGSAGSMEVEGIKRLFERSEENGLRYTTYVGDGDSRSFTTIQRLQPYGPDVEIIKEECVGHIQKRMGTRLRSLIAKSKGQKLSDGKGLQGAGRLTLARVNAFQRFYGHTLRTYAGNPEMGSRSTMAMLDHYSDPPNHSLCPDGASSWCKFKQDVALGTTTYLPPKHPLPAAVVNYIRPVFTNLSSVALLQQTQQALTQNTNESLHHLIWSLAPKEQYNSNTEVSLAIKLAVMRFNRGLSTTYNRLFQQLGIPLTESAKRSFSLQDKNRICTSAYATSEKHKQMRAERNQAKYKDRGFVPMDYSSGAFHQGLKREPPKCTNCGKPRKGHPRGVCEA